ncbi:MAG: alanine racemase [Bacteroidota bacterium]
MLLDKITTPTLLVNKDKVLRNIERMAKKAEASNTILRPHFKTHQSHEIGRWFRTFGVNSITVSSLQMAAYFAADGWDDIVVAFPVNVREIEQLNSLAERTKLTILVESREVMERLDAELTTSVDFYINIDIGYGRTGIMITDLDAIDSILDVSDVSKTLNFIGFYTHAGNTYRCKKKKPVTDIFKLYEHGLMRLKEQYTIDYPAIKLSYGDTPSCSILKDFSNFDEIHPGNFAFYDMQQKHISSCSLDAIAVAMACPVVAKHESRSELVIHGGGVHFSTERARRPENVDYFGLIVAFKKGKWHVNEMGSYIRALSQEHGVIKASEELMAKTNVGDIVVILPIHSCMTADAMSHYMDLEGQIIEKWNGETVNLA